MRFWRVAYWFVTGACLGMGLVPWALGLFLLGIGVVLALAGVFLLRGREAVAAVLGLGAGPLALFAYIQLLGTVTGTGVQVVYAGLAISGALTVVGVAALVIVWRTHRRGSGPATT